MYLTDIVRSHEYGNIVDLEEQNADRFEIFDGFNDINDQAVVAKARDTQICFAAFQSTLDISANFIGYFLGT